MATFKLLSDNPNPNTWKVLIAAKYSAINVEPTYGVDVNSKDFLAKAPTGKPPVLETPEGPIFEANAIVRYVAKLGRNNLYGSNAFEAAQVEQWIEFASIEIDLPVSVWVFPILGYIPDNKEGTQRAKGDVRKVLDILNKHLQTRTFLVGERISLADIVVSMSLFYAYQRVLDSGFRKQFVNTNRWYLTIVNQPEVKPIVGEVKLSEKMEIAPHVETKEEAPKEQKPKEKKEQKPKEKKEEKPKKDDEEPEEDEFKEEKKKSALDDLPPSKFIMDEWKRTYSNKDIRKEAIPWFWEHLDKEGYSVWFADYKYNNECEKLFMTCNLIGGFCQRLDKLRKYGFGSLIIFGEEPKLEIGSCWLFRGQNVPLEMQEVDDYEQYNWKKAELSDPAVRDLVNDYWAWDGTFGGTNKKINQGKVFK